MSTQYFCLFHLMPSLHWLCKIVKQVCTFVILIAHIILYTRFTSMFTNHVLNVLIQFPYIFYLYRPQYGESHFKKIAVKEESQQKKNLGISIRRISDVVEVSAPLV
ncbi:uncharacterized protein LOC120359145 [Solenopsis invicta]|uniref:uncharacterized protein LOC120359145 n=1 Tax=Solenopsis invicta TaxID=13686 RepID=UPI00193E6B5F|nr:uncharacterized protein LOC120359145 [Solenopsis invicta]